MNTTTAYIETSIPSFYFTGRTDPLSIARQRWTQLWWAKFADEFRLYSSLAVIPMETNPMREIRTIRRQISEECGNDPETVFDYYQARQDQLKATGKYKLVTEPLAAAGDYQADADHQPTLPLEDRPTLI